VHGRCARVLEQRPPRRPVLALPTAGSLQQVAAHGGVAVRVLGRGQVGVAVHDPVVGLLLLCGGGAGGRGL
jgi:hypothetical protein